MSQIETISGSLEQKRLFKELEMAYDDLSAYSQHPMFRQEEREAQQRVTALREALEAYKEEL
tara:strand:+ start:471 stop:656 length:186 start_codon:yes stop_codon:yes gene_type:complete